MHPTAARFAARLRERGLEIEVKRLEDFEGVVQLGLGVNGSGCYRAFFLTNPDRLVIDLQGAG